MINGEPDEISFDSPVNPLCLLLPGTGLAAGVDNSIYAQLLAKHIKKGRVNYEGFKQDQPLLNQYLSILSRTDPESLTRNHKFAFYINAYNAFTIKLILTRYPDINSIKELGSFFQVPGAKNSFLWVDGPSPLTTLNMRCSGPNSRIPGFISPSTARPEAAPLLNRPYEGETLEQQLDEQTRAFINNKRATFFKAGSLFISKIFDWFDEDFNNNPLLFIRQYAGEPLLSELDKAGPGIKISYLYYDWTLNRL